MVNIHYTRDWLYLKYVVEGLSIEEIAEIMGLKYPPHVKGWLVRYGIIESTKWTDKSKYPAPPRVYGRIGKRNIYNPEEIT